MVLVSRMPDDVVNPPESSSRLGVKVFLVQWQNIIATVVSLICFVVLLYFFRGQVTHFVENREAILSGLEWIQTYVNYHEGWSAVVFVLLYAIANSVFIPQFALGLAGGLIFGFPVGFVLVLIGIIGSSQTYFWVAKSLGRPFLEKFGWVELELFRHHLSRIDTETLFKLRLNPMIPYHPLNASCGLYSVSLVGYLVGTVFGLAPRALVYVFLGASLTGDDSMFIASVVFWILAALAHFSFGFWQIHGFMRRESE